MAAIGGNAVRVEEGAPVATPALRVVAPVTLTPVVTGRPDLSPVDWSWKPILERCRTVARAHTVIAIDGDGDAVAWSGCIDAEQAARIAAHVATSFDLLDRLKYVGRFAECLCAEYDPENEWLTAVRVAPKVSTVVTIAVLGPLTLVHRGRDLLRRTFLRLLEETWKL